MTGKLLDYETSVLPTQQRSFFPCRPNTHEQSPPINHPPTHPCTHTPPPPTHQSCIPYLPGPQYPMSLVLPTQLPTYPSSYLPTHPTSPAFLFPETQFTINFVLPTYVPTYLPTHPPTSSHTEPPILHQQNDLVQVVFCDKGIMRQSDKLPGGSAG